MNKISHLIRLYKSTITSAFNIVWILEKLDFHKNIVFDPQPYYILIGCVLLP